MKFWVFFCVGLLTFASRVNAQTVSAPDPLSPDFKSAPLQEWEKEFNAFSYRKTEKDGHLLPYRFYQPVNIRPGKKYPLVLFFHGAGERGNDNRKQLMRFHPAKFWEKEPCYIIAPQCPAPEDVPAGGDASWVQTGFGWPLHQMKTKPTWPMQLAMELLDSVIRHTNIDTTRIYVTGLSMGGFATWEILQREGHLFAAAVPVCGGADTSFAKQLIEIPIWTFHGDADETVLPQRSVDMVNAIQQHGGKQVKLTMYPGVGHDAWTQTYGNMEVWNWLFRQRKRD